ncbi:MAG: ACT domain-containing protein [Bacteroidota bacterium]
MSTDLEKLLQHLQPHLHEGQYVFCTVQQPAALLITSAICSFREMEGTTIILKRELADEAGLDYSYVAAWITLEVHSSLDAIGLTAAFSAALAAEGMSCNVVAGYHHDHIFVDHGSASKAMAVLRGLSKP